MGDTDNRITDEEIALNPDMYRDEDGVHLKIPGGVLHIEFSESFMNRQKELEAIVTIPEPTQEEYMMDLDYRLSMIELGI